jgi:hypothetical protein
MHRSNGPTQNEQARAEAERRGGAAQSRAQAEAERADRGEATIEEMQGQSLLRYELTHARETQTKETPKPPAPANSRRRTRRDRATHRAALEAAAVKTRMRAALRPG